MTWPAEYQRASVDFERFMVAARDAAGLQTTNMAWTMVEAVLHAFRRRLSTKDAIAFAVQLAPVVRALFLEGWRPDDRPEPFASPNEILHEVRALRHEHNFAPDNAVEAVATALRATMGVDAFDRSLAGLPDGARRFWGRP
jgi:uncharacterized protein (DUF2267 family)